MASPLIFSIQSKADTGGAQQTAKSMENVRQSFVKASTASASFSQGLLDMKNLVAGSVLALPFAAFVKDAMQSEEVTARFGMKLRTLGEDAGQVIPNLIGLTDKAHKAGITQTELIQAVSSGATYFKSTSQELALLDTAMGMTKVRGIDLATAFNQLGQITLGYGTRIARQYGVSMHNEIHDPTARGAKIIEELTAKLAPLAGQTGTANEAFKELGATFKDLGESVGSVFVGPIGDAVKWFNSLDESMKKAIVVTGLFVTTTAALSRIMSMGFAAKMASDMGVLGRALTFNITTMSQFGIVSEAILKTFIGRLALILEVLWAVSKVTEAMKVWKETEEAKAQTLATEASMQDRMISAYKTHLGDLGKETNEYTNLVKLSKQLADTRIALGFKENDLRERGKAKLADQVKAEKELTAEREKSVNKMLEGTQYSAAEYKKIAQLRVAIMADGLEKELALSKLKAIDEREALKNEFKKNVDIRFLMVQEETKREYDERVKWAEKELTKKLDYALMSKAEQKKQDEDSAKVQEILSKNSIDSLKDETVENKELLKSQKELTDAWLKEQAKKEANRGAAEDEHDKAVQAMGLERNIANDKQRVAEIEASKKKGEKPSEELEALNRKIKENETALEVLKFGTEKPTKAVTGPLDMATQIATAGMNVEATTVKWLNLNAKSVTQEKTTTPIETATKFWGEKAAKAVNFTINVTANASPIGWGIQIGQSLAKFLQDSQRDTDKQGSTRQ